MSNNNRGFTLIELLVVIAIIAILAAILFPVFAQAKSQAKKAASISNNKQITLGAIMYMNDYDDRFMIASYNMTYDANPAHPDAVPLMMAYPYIKNEPIMMDPMDPAGYNDRMFPPTMTVNPNSVPYKAQQQFFNFCDTADWGINSQYFNPTYIDYPNNKFAFVQHAITQTEIVRPAETYMAVSSIWYRTASGAPIGGGNPGVDPPCIYDQNYNDTRYAWANDFGYHWYGGWNPSTPLAWNVFGGVWPWHSGGTMVIASYADGHAKSSQLTSLAAGCNVLDSWAGIITDKSKYSWATTF